MARFFNTAGPNDPARHYTVPVLARLPSVGKLIDQGLYFVLHAPRQVGKTTSLLHLGRELTAAGTYVSLLVSMEVGAAFGNDIGAAELAVLDGWRARAEAELPQELQPPAWPDAPPGARIAAALEAWAYAAPRPLVIFLDEVDTLEGDTLTSVLRQIRTGHPNRPARFPHCLALSGLRPVRDYHVTSGGSDRFGDTSFFNIHSDSLTLRNFTREEVNALYGQHTTETGQLFAPDAVERAFTWTRGHPCLVNTLAQQLTDVLVPNRAQTITAVNVDEAAEVITRRQDTHLGSLLERLREPGVRTVVAPMIAGRLLIDVSDDDLRFAMDLGIVRRSPHGGLEFANPIYHEVVARTLAGAARDALQ